MRRSWAVGLIIISILTMACGGAASVDDYKAAFVYVAVSYTHLTLPTTPYV